MSVFKFIGSTDPGSGSSRIRFGELRLNHSSASLQNGFGGVGSLRSVPPLDYNLVTLDSVLTITIFKMSSFKQILINAFLKVSATDPALDREGGPTAEEARDDFLVRFLTELGFEPGTDSAFAEVPMVEPKPAVSPAKKLTKEEKEAAKVAKEAEKAAKAAEREAIAKAKEEAKAAKEAEKAARQRRR
jgi:hypothetical protein